MEALNSQNIYEKIKAPTLMIAAGKDRVVSYPKILEFFENMETDKQLLKYDEVDHNLFQDGEYLPLIVKDIVDWMDC